MTRFCSTHRFRWLIPNALHVTIGNLTSCRQRFLHWCSRTYPSFSSTHRFRWLIHNLFIVTIGNLTSCRQRLLHWSSQTYACFCSTHRFRWLIHKLFIVTFVFILLSRNENSVRVSAKNRDQLVHFDIFFETSRNPATP
jgi:hypothetical protein